VANPVAQRARDDGETLGVLWRPSGGFQVSSGWVIARLPNADHAYAEELEPSEPSEPWLVPVGEEEIVPWPRGNYPWLREFAKLGSRSDATIATFASAHGWLRHGISIRAQSGGPATWGDRVSAWRQESSCVAEWLELLESAKSPDLEVNRRRIVDHFTRDAGVPPLVAGGPPAINVRGAEFPPDRAALARATGPQLAAVARSAVATAADLALRVETVGTLTMTGGIRVRPQSLLGAVYVGVAAELFNRRGQRECPVCHVYFTPRRKDQTYCLDPGKGCKWKAYRSPEAKAKRQRQQEAQSA
jgi:hypothetical protein